MAEITTAVSDDLYTRLAHWAKEQQKPLPALVNEILIAAERTRDRYDPTMSQSTRWIRMCRDGGCGLCEELEPLFAERKTQAPI